MGYFNRGIAYKKLKLYNNAIKDFTEAIRLKRDFLEAYYNRSIVFKELGKPGLAKQDEEKTKALQNKQ